MALTRTPVFRSFLDSHSLYCGFENAIEIFDVGSPGAEGYRLHTTPTRSSREGQKGAIRCLLYLLYRALLTACCTHRHRLLTCLLGPEPYIGLVLPGGRLFLGHSRAVRPFAAQSACQPVVAFSARRSHQGAPSRVNILSNLHNLTSLARVRTDSLPSSLAASPLRRLAPVITP